MKITNKWLEKHNACVSGMQWFNGQAETDSIKVINRLMKEDRFDWAIWVLVHLMNRKQKLKYGIFCAEKVIGVFEKTYPTDKSPRKAIEAAKKVLKHDTKKNREIARAAGDGVRFYGVGADSACAAARVAAGVFTAAYVADAASYAVDVDENIKYKIVNYGINLLK